MNKTFIETMLWHIQREIMQRHGVDASYRMMSPLNWYVSTGRASIDFLRRLSEAQPVLIARDLAKGGSDDEILRRIFKRIGYSPAA